MNLYIVTIRNQTTPLNVIADDYNLEDDFFVFVKEDQIVATVNSVDVISIMKAPTD